MSDLRTEHRKAMDLAERAFIAMTMEGRAKAKALFEKALKAELAALDFARKESVSEPTFSVLHRSAASLAISASQFRLAERLIAQALSGDPPIEIAEELRDLLETVYSGGLLTHVEEQRKKLGQSSTLPRKFKNDGH